MKTTKEVIQILESHGITDDSAMIDALEDGEALPAMELINRTGRKMGEAYRRHKAAQPAPLSFRELMADMTVSDEQTILRGMPWTG